MVILSAHEEEHTRAKALDAGAEGYVTKEGGIKELTSSVRAASPAARPVLARRRPDGSWIISGNAGPATLRTGSGSTG